MHSRKVRWITAFSAVACLLWVFGLGWTVKDYLFGAGTAAVQPSTGTDSTVVSNAMTIVALGDSLTRGMGDIEGKGYVGYVGDRLKQEGLDITLVNLGIKGLTSFELVEQIKQKEIERQIRQADMILMTIGGNDLFLGGQSLMDPSEENIRGLEEGYTTNLNVILSSIQTANPDAIVYVLGLYDPFNELESGELTSRVVRGWNYKMTETMAGYPNAVFVPTYDLFQRSVSHYLFSDQFHPNEKGYLLMADRVAALILEAGGRQP
ncbi:GDSL-type esterase/lipase family protein [Paenibacillus sp. sgz302251]|uniref:GDSL-type esterase/lipase family protein n=1 Tax=Paenibacillus sp. sgz302251 TaxID=3414493 RepID=UPI003C7E242B